MVRCNTTCDRYRYGQLLSFFNFVFLTVLVLLQCTVLPRADRQTGLLWTGYGVYNDG